MTAFVPGYEYDVFISFAELDNHDGWVETLKQELQVRVNSKLPHKSDRNFFFSRSHIDPNASLTDTVREAVHQAAILVVVLSDSYCGSRWCREERELFIQHAGGREAAKGRIFVIRHSALGTDLRDEAQLSERPAELRDFLGVQFYEVDQQLNVPETFATDDKRFAKWLNYLRFQVAKQLLQMRDEAGLNDPRPGSGAEVGKVVEVADDQAVVYLAECTFDQWPNYAALQTFLEQHSPPIRVVPGHVQFSHAPAGYEKSVTAAISQCDLFVQLLGGKPFPANEAFADGYEWWLCDLARRHQKQVLRWQREDGEDSVGAVAGSADVVGGEVVTGAIEDFMKLVAGKALELRLSRIHQRQKEQERRGSASGDSDSAFVLLKAETVDLPGAYKLADTLFQRRIGVDPINGEMTVSEAAAGSSYDAVLLYYGNCRPDWIHQAQREYRNLLVKAPEALPRHLIVYMAPPSREKQLRTRLGDVQVIEGDDARAPERIVKIVRGQEGDV